MLGLTKKTEYALIALTHLAREGETKRSAREIAEQHNVPLPLLMNVLKTLQQKKLVKSTRGAHGGYALAAPADLITLDAIIQAMEGVVSLTQCTADDGGATKGCCDRTGCPVRSPVKKINDQFRGFLRTVTLSQLSNRSVGENTLTELAVQLG